MPHPLAGTPVPADMLMDVPALLAAYAEAPDVHVATQRVAFGTSGHRGSSLTRSFNEAHILAITQAVCEYRARQGTPDRCSSARTRTRSPIPRNAARSRCSPPMA